MVAEIQKLEAAARMAMGSFEDHAIGAAAASRDPALTSSSTVFWPWPWSRW